MSLRAPPLRFLVLVVGGWTAARIAMTMPDWTEDPAGGNPPNGFGPTAVAASAAAPSVRPPAPDQAAPALLFAQLRAATRTAATAPPAAARVSPTARFTGAPPLPARGSILPPAQAPRALPPALLRPQRRAARWSASAWLLVRPEGGARALTPGGTLGGSQVGARLLYRLNDDAARPLSASARLYLPLRRPAGAEAALGLDWRPSARLPLHLLVERREALGAEGRSAFAFTVYGGAETRLPGGLRLDLYGQSGLVGLRARDPFADGAARLTRRLGPVELGGGAWAAAQPGAARLDAGPVAAWRLPVDGAGLRLAAEWRFRLAGDAEPDSGPALTVSAGF